MMHDEWEKQGKEISIEQILLFLLSTRKKLHFYALGSTHYCFMFFWLLHVYAIVEYFSLFFHLIFLKIGVTCLYIDSLCTNILEICDLIILWLNTRIFIYENILLGFYFLRGNYFVNGLKFKNLKSNFGANPD